jgi:hypothetical protein
LFAKKAPKEPSAASPPIRLLVYATVNAVAGTLPLSPKSLPPPMVKLTSFFCANALEENNTARKHALRNDLNMNSPRASLSVIC